MKKVDIDPGALQKTKWHEYLVRFVFGGLVTVAAGMVAKKYGPVIGGLFLAFPAIFPASVTLVQQHVQKEHGSEMGRKAAGVDAAGARLGSVALAAFALVAWRSLPDGNPWVALGAAMVTWLAAGPILWFGRRELLHHMRRGERAHGGRPHFAPRTRPPAGTGV